MQNEKNFNPRAPCGARRHCVEWETSSLHFNPRAPCGARRSFGFRLGSRNDISIRVPLAGHDIVSIGRISSQRYFNPRAPCGARLSAWYCNYICDEFQSACPLRGTTDHPAAQRRIRAISIRVPLAGHDIFSVLMRRRLLPDFNPRAPCGARQTTACVMVFMHNFNPRAPCGARPGLLPCH